MGSCINQYGKQCVPDGVILENLKEMIDDGMDINEILALRFPSFLPHRRIEDTYEAARDELAEARKTLAEIYNAANRHINHWQN